MGIVVICVYCHIYSLDLLLIFMISIRTEIDSRLEYYTVIRILSQLLSSKSTTSERPLKVSPYTILKTQRETLYSGITRDTFNGVEASNINALWREAFGILESQY